MTRKIDRLVANADIAQRLGVKRSAVSNWSARHPEFPQPVLSLGAGTTPVWDWDDVVAWVIATGRGHLLEHDQDDKATA